MIHTINIKTTQHEQLINITAEVSRAIKLEGINDGICYIYTPHTTAGITINENADADVPADILKGLKALNLETVPFKHVEGNSPAHIKSSIIGCSSFVFIENGRLKLGTWQGIFFCEFDGPRSREVYVKITS